VTWQEGLAHLASRSPSAIKMGLDRVREALARLGHPERRVPALHVAGTNGKGSVCAIAAACLTQRYRTGLYTSPHLERVNERFRVDGEAISDEALGSCVAGIVARLGVAHELTYFELGTLVAFQHFADAGVEIAVLETGLGGRLDATTACAPIVTAITSIDFDHQEYLGSTLGAIAGEKAGIVKAGVPLVTSRQAPEALDVLARAAPSLWLEGRDFESNGTAYRGQRWKLDGLSLALSGPHQRQNLAVALAALEVLSERGFPLTDDEVRRGVAATRWPGRFERFAGAPTVILDGAHNPAGARALRAALDAAYPGVPVHLVFGVLADKELPPMLEALIPRAATVHLCAPTSERARPPERYAAEAERLGAAVSAHASPREALEAARAVAAPDSLVVIAGSLVLVGELRRVVAR
jgi:dihydrofolate synthase/folylpolyglutamate synthase